MPRRHPGARLRGSGARFGYHARVDGYVALGSNLGDRVAQLGRGIAGLGAAGLRVVARSSVWETEPVGTLDPARFLNMVVRIATDLPPPAVLDLLLDVERASGRVRTLPNAPRVLDLDLLLLEGQSWNDSRLTLPHPRMWERRFVLEPLRELAPGLRHPLSGETIEEVCRRLGEGPGVQRVGPASF